MRRAGLAVSLLAAAAPAAPQEVSLTRVGSGARAAGMGNAFIAISDDGTAASWNPAGLSQLVKPEFSLVHTASRRGRTFEGFLSRDQSSAFTALETWDAAADIEFASAAVPFRLGGKPVTLQVGWRRLYQLGSRLQGDFRRVPLAPTTRPGSALRVDAATEGSIHLWTVAGAARVTDRLSLGWSLDFLGGGWEGGASISEDPGILGPTDFFSSAQTDPVGGHYLSFGLLLAYPSLSVGAVYHGGLRGDFTEILSHRACDSPRARPVTSTWATPGRRCSTGCSRAGTGARSCCGSRTPTRSARLPPPRRPSSRTFAGWASPGTRDRAWTGRSRRIGRRSGWRSTVSTPSASWPAVARITASAAPINSKTIAPRRSPRGVCRHTPAAAAPSPPTWWTRSWRWARRPPSGSTSPRATTSRSMTACGARSRSTAVSPAMAAAAAVTGRLAEVREFL